MFVIAERLLSLQEGLCVMMLVCSSTKYSGTSVVERLSSRTNRFLNIKPKHKTHRFPNRQTDNQVREMYGGRASVTSQPPLSAAACLFLIFLVFCCFRLYFIYLLCLLFLFKILCIFIVFVYDFMHEVLL
jgi:hypothetical protein